MEKRISYAEFQSVKSVAKACSYPMAKRERIKEQIQKLAEEYKMIDEQIKTLEAGVKQVLGFRVEELVRKVSEPGSPTKYLPTDIVVYDEVKKQYVITVPDEAPEDLQQPAPEHEEPADVEDEPDEDPFKDTEIEESENPLPF